MKRSNLTLKSNIYVRTRELDKDKNFHKHVLDKEAIKSLIYYGSLNEYSDLTPNQREIMEKGASCSYNKDEIPYGLVEDKNGELHWECRCENIDCKIFYTCRPELSKKDIEDIRENLPIEEEKEEDIINLATIRRIKDEEVKAEISATIQEAHIGLLPRKDDVEIEEVTKKKVIQIETKDMIPLVRGEEVEQERIVTSSVEDRIFVNAGPGTGKTHTLINRIKYITVEEQSVEPQELMVLCFSRTAIGEINDRLSKNVFQDRNLYRLNMLDVRTFDSFATYLIKFLEPEMDLKGKEYDERIEIAIELMKKNPDVLMNYKHIIIDEIQDLVGVRARLVKTILETSNCGFTLFGDTCQSIYNYQVKDKLNEMDTNAFYNWILTSYLEDLKCYELKHNFRQEQNLAMITEEIRESILEDSSTRQKELILERLDSFKHLGKTYKISNTIENFKHDKISFLCRNNGQALKVSNQLSNQGIGHKLLKSANFKVLDRWIGECFSGSEKLISYQKFNEKCKFILNLEENEVQHRWDILKEIEEGKSSKLDVEELSFKLSYKKHMYENLCINRESKVEVSTIHRAKGREFERVILLNDNIFVEEDSENIEDENKIYYVALTRPREEMYTISLGERNRIKKSNDNNGRGRWYETYWNFNKKKHTLVSIEVGREKDIDTLSFVSDTFLGLKSDVEFNQKYILNNIAKNDEVVLRLVEKNGMAVGYDIYHEDIKIGKMSNEFLAEFYGVLRENYRIPSKEAKFFPPTITDVYIDEICTYVLDRESIMEESNEYISRGLWNGITLTGFGKCRYKTTY